MNVNSAFYCKCHQLDNFEQLLSLHKTLNLHTVLIYRALARMLIVSEWGF